MNYKKRNKLSSLAKSKGFTHAYEYRQYVKAVCTGTLSDFRLNRCNRHLSKANDKFNDTITTMQRDYKRKAAKIFYNLMQYHGSFDNAFDVVVDNPTEFVKDHFPGLLKIFDSVENREVNQDACDN